LEIHDTHHDGTIENTDEKGHDQVLGFLMTLPFLLIREKNPA
jgi:hypothetical protein